MANKKGLYFSLRDGILLKNRMYHYICKERLIYG